MVVRKFNYYRFAMFILIIALIIFCVVKYVSHKKYQETTEYKLLTLGYELSEIEVLQDKLSESEMEIILKRDRNEYIDDFLKEKYFIFDNLDKYLDYKKENKKEDNSKIVSIINTEANIEWIDNEKQTDITKGELMLVNRIYSLGEYEPEDLVSVPVGYSYSGIKLSESILPHIEELIGDAKEAGYKIVVSSGYRSFKDQERIYNNYERSHGTRETDEVVARPGHSEYQTGLTLEFDIYGETGNKLESEAYNWLITNAKNYGFILRHTKEKEDLTLYNAASWKFRYVGVEAAQKMSDENLCFEEYYAYYVRG